MKILFCTKNDIFGAIILNWILPKLQGHQLKVLLSDKTRPAENAVPELVEEKYLERELPLNMLFPLIDAQDALSGELLTFRALARRHQLSIEPVYNINDAASEAMIRDWAPDVIVSARFSLIFKANILQIPRFGVYNIHPGALPGYAGLCAPLHALVNGETRLGCTLHAVDEGIDTGPVYSVSWLPAEPARSVFGHISDLYQLGLTSLLTLLGELEQGKTPQVSVQDKAAFRYFHLPEAAEFVALRQRGAALVSYAGYVDLLKRFWPFALPVGAPGFFSPQALEQATAERRQNAGSPAIAAN